VIPGLMILLAGCGKPAPPTEVEVAGKVLDASGEGLSKMVIRFTSQDESHKGLETRSFPTKEGGAFEGKLLPGKYKVTIFGIPVSHGAAPGKGAPAAPPLLPGNIPKRYSSTADTPWEADVPTGGKTDFEFRIE
jgi:hypothetical protein